LIKSKDGLRRRRAGLRGEGFVDASLVCSFFFKSPALSENYCKRAHWNLGVAEAKNGSSRGEGQGGGGEDRLGRREGKPRLLFRCSF